MIRSMTGYGQGRVTVQGHRLEMELRSVNHRFCEITLKLPKPLVFLEPEIKKRLKERFPRGRLDLQVTLNETKTSDRRLEIDLPLAKQYRHALQELKSRLKVKGDIDLALLTDFRNLITVEERPTGSKRLIPAFYRLLNQAVSRLDRMRQREGRVLARDLKSRLEQISRSVGIIKKRVPQVLTDYRERLMKRVKWLTKGTPLDSQRLEQEVALYATRCDISEEMTRIESHLSQFRTMIMARKAVGRSLDFLIQEMHREINTTGSKANDTDISRQVILIKSELERLREQIQNVE
jgi:uncharacterized protein (TIGR00255 family)